MQGRFRTYVAYSVGALIAWAAILLVVAFGAPAYTQTILLVFGGWTIGWLSGSIGRYVYPPPRRWLGGARSEKAST
jgi:hypothetical protein